MRVMMLLATKSPCVILMALSAYIYQMLGNCYLDEKQYFMKDMDQEYYVNNQDEKEEICVVDDEYQPMEN